MLGYMGLGGSSWCSPWRSSGLVVPNFTFSISGLMTRPVCNGLSRHKAKAAAFYGWRSVWRREAGKV